MELKIEINLDNAAFEDAPHTETRRMLARVAEDICDAQAWHLGAIEAGSIRDIDGNTVGTWKVE